MTNISKQVLSHPFLILFAILAVWALTLASALGGAATDNSKPWLVRAIVVAKDDPDTKLWSGSKRTASFDTEDECKEALPAVAEADRPMIIGQLQSQVPFELDVEFSCFAKGRDA